MKLPFSYKKNAFGTLLTVSVLGHVLLFSLGGFASPKAQYSVMEAPNSLEVVMLSQPKQEIQEKQINKVKRVLVTKEPVQETVKQVEEKPREIAKPKTPEIVKPKKEVRPPVQQLNKGAQSKAKPVRQKNKPPTYPNLAREKGWEGMVILTVSVTTSGTVGSLDIKESSGYRILDRSALRAVRKWKFTPAKLGNHSIASTVEIPIRFKLENN